MLCIHRREVFVIFPEQVHNSLIIRSDLIELPDVKDAGLKDNIQHFGRFIVASVLPSRVIS